jgi:hypothetical protein
VMIAFRADGVETGDKLRFRKQRIGSGQAHR